MGVIWVNIEGGVFSALQGGQAPEVTAGTCQLVRRTIGNLHRIIFCTFCRRSGRKWEEANICKQYWTSFNVCEKSKVVKLCQRFISFVTAWCAMAYQKECLQNVIMWLQILCKIKETQKLHYMNTVHQAHTWNVRSVTRSFNCLDPSYLPSFPSLNTFQPFFLNLSPHTTGDSIIHQLINQGFSASTSLCYTSLFSVLTRPKKSSWANCYY